MDITSKTFCVLPFIHKHQRLSGAETVCCFSQTPLHGDDLLNVQTGLLSDVQVPNCAACWKYEALGIESHRQRENNRWLQDPEIKEYLSRYEIGDQLKTFSFDLRYSNTCNLACIGCTPQQSSLWAKELKIKYEPTKTKFNHSQVENAKWIYMAGGEPFLTEEMVDLLEFISTQETQPALCINTNLTVQDDRVKEICSKLTSLTLHISIDGINDVAEYHRWPIKWNKFKRNLEWAKDLDCRITFNTIVDAVNVSFIHEIMEYEHYASNWTVTPIMGPMPLQIKHLPEHLKQFAYDNFSKLRQSTHYKNDSSFRNNIETIINQISMAGSPRILAEFITKLDTRRNINHRDYLGINLSPQ